MPPASLACSHTGGYAGWPLHRGGGGGGLINIGLYTAEHGDVVPIIARWQAHCYRALTLWQLAAALAALRLIYCMHQFTFSCGMQKFDGIARTS